MARGCGGIVIKPTELQNTMVQPDEISKPEFPPNQLESRSGILCELFGHRRVWELHHAGSQWEVFRCRRCGDTMGGTRKAGS